MTSKPRRQRGEGSVYQRASDGLWVGSIDLGWIDGKRRRKTITARTQAAAIKKLREARKAIDAGQLNTATLTVEKWVEHWLEHIAPTTRKPQVLRGDRSMVRAHILPQLGRIKLDKLSQAHVRQLHQSIYAKGLSSTTALNVHRLLNKILNDAMRENLLGRNVAELTNKPKPAKSTRDGLSLDDVRALIAHLDGDRLQSRWAFALFTGARQGECLGLRWSHIDFAEGTADIAWQLQRIPYKHGCGKRAGKWVCGRRADHCPTRSLDVRPGYEYHRLNGNLCLQRPKTEGSRRVIPLAPPLLVALQERRHAYLDERHTYSEDHDLVWPRPDGRPAKAGDDLQEWYRHLDALEIERQVLHTARHTASTLLLALGVPEHVRMSILGHSEAATNRAYSHVDLSMQRAAMETFAAAVSKQLEG